MKSIQMEQREEWRKQMEDGTFEELYYVTEYRKHRDDPFWRAPMALEQLCEYIIFLEEKVIFLEEKIMQEK